MNNQKQMGERAPVTVKTPGFPVFASASPLTSGIRVKLSVEIPPYAIASAREKVNDILRELKIVPLLEPLKVNGRPAERPGN